MTNIIHLLKLAVCNHKGTGHKVAHNITTMLNIPLFAWLVYSIFSLSGASHEEFLSFLSQPVNLTALILFIIVTLTHFMLEIEVVFEDYISDIKKQKRTIMAMKMFFGFLEIVTIVSIIKITL